MLGLMTLAGAIDVGALAQAVAFVGRVLFAWTLVSLGTGVLWTLVMSRGGDARIAGEGAA
jgi:hypothetical protein